MFKRLNQNFMKLRITLLSCHSTNQSCRRLPNFGRSPEFGSFQKIAQKIAQNFCAIFKIGPKPPQKASKCYRNVEKAPEIAQNFYIFVKSTPKSSRKAPKCFKNITELFRFCQKYPKKLPKSSRILERFQSGDNSATNDLAAAHSRILHLHRCSRPDQTRKRRQNRETLLPIGSLFRDMVPYRDLYANFGPYWVFISSKRSLFLLFWHAKKDQKT